MSQVVTPVEAKGGLDHTTAKLSQAVAGSLRDCKNYEVATLGGYQKIAGFTLLDKYGYYTDRVGFFKYPHQNLTALRLTITYGIGSGQFNNLPATDGAFPLPVIAKWFNQPSSAQTATNELDPYFESLVQDRVYIAKGTMPSLTDAKNAGNLFEVVGLDCITLDKYSLNQVVVIVYCVSEFPDQLPYETSFTLFKESSETPLSWQRYSSTDPYALETVNLLRQEGSSTIQIESPYLSTIQNVVELSDSLLGQRVLDSSSNSGHYIWANSLSPLGVRNPVLYKDFICAQGDIFGPVEYPLSDWNAEGHKVGDVIFDSGTNRNFEIAFVKTNSTTVEFFLREYLYANTAVTNGTLKKGLHNITSSSWSNVTIGGPGSSFGGAVTLPSRSYKKDTGAEIPGKYATYILFKDTHIRVPHLGIEFPFENGRIKPFGRDRSVDGRFSFDSPTDGLSIVSPSYYPTQFGAVEDTGWLSPGSLEYPSSVVDKLYNSSNASILDDQGMVVAKDPVVTALDKKLVYASDFGAAIPEDALVVGIEVRTRRIQDHIQYSSYSYNSASAGAVGRVQLVAGDVDVNGSSPLAISSSVLYDAGNVADVPLYRSANTTTDVTSIRSYGWNGYYEWDSATSSWVARTGDVPFVTVGTDGFTSTMSATWGQEFSREVVMDSTFGLLYMVTQHSTTNTSSEIYGGPNSWSVDSIQVKIHYIRKGQKVYFADKNTNTPIARGDLIYAYKSDGDWETGGNPFAKAIDPRTGREYLSPIPPSGGDAAGQFTVTNLQKINWTDSTNFTIVDMSYYNPLRILDPNAANISVYTSLLGAATGVGEICSLSGEGTILLLPGSGKYHDYYGNGARPQNLIHNYYSNSRQTTLYTADNTDRARAFEFDPDSGKAYFHKIYILNDDAQDTPALLGKSSYSLAVSYDSGTVAISRPGEPENFYGDEGAAVYEFGEEITGLQELVGGVLGIFTPNRIFALYPDQSVKTVAPSAGALKYSVQSMGGTVVFCDAQGVRLLESTTNFGDFQLNTFTSKVSAEFVANVTGTGINGLSTTGISRSTNQYKIFTKGGTVFSLTWEGQNVSVTKQNYRVDGVSLGDARVLDYFSGRISTGEEIKVGVIDDGGFTSQYDSQLDWRLASGVVQFDIGYSFAGYPFEFYIEFNPVHSDNPIQQLQYQFVDVHVMEQGGYASDIYTGGDYLRPTSTQVVYPDEENSASQFIQDGQYRVVKYAVKRRGTNITIKLSDTGITPHHAVQALMIYGDQDATEKAYANSFGV